MNLPKQPHRPLLSHFLLCLTIILSVVSLAHSSIVHSQELSQTTRVFFPLLASPPRSLSFTYISSRPILRIYGVFRTELYKTSPITLTTSIDTHSTWAPDGSQFAVVHQENNSYSLDVLNAQGSSRQTIFTCPRRCATPVWSPTGDTLVFSMLAPNSSETSDIYRLSSNGAELLQLTFDEGDELDPSWSPDGSFIAFAATSSDLLATTLKIVDRNGRQVETLSPPVKPIFHPSWSPDGQRLVFSSVQELYTISRNGSDFATLDLGLTNGAFVSEPVWSPDGRYIAYTSTSVGFPSIAIVDTIGTDDRVLTAGVNPAWIP